MSKQLLKSLKTLIKVEKAKISELQPTLHDLSNKIAEIEQQITILNETLIREKNFLNDQILSIDFINFFNRIEMEKKNLLIEKEILLEEYNILHDEMMEYVKIEKSYETISNRLKSTLEYEKEKKEFDTIEDLILMRKNATTF
ncbi:MAG: hypothetical protein KBD31_01090 [Proteobacteria bacterium]|nr:hypothetical protein [Pseudomonadota bacterium]